jgi:hypothetical protein
MLSAPKFPEDPFSKDSGDFTLRKFVQINPKQQKFQPSLERYYSHYLRSVPKKSEREELGKHLIWCHEVILDKIFNCLESLKPEMKSTELFNLLFDMLYILSDKDRILRPLRKSIV